METMPDGYLETCIACIFIFAGAVVMLLNFFRFKKNIDAARAIPKRHHRKISFFLGIHRAMMGFFFCCYIAVGLLFTFNVYTASRFFVGLVFFLGSVFVLTGISIQYRLLSEVQRTVRKLLPICSFCKRIRTDEKAPDNLNSWKSIEAYLSEKSDVDFSHGLCPNCFQKQLKTISRAKKPPTVKAV
jgi:hypothetical protein